MSFIKIAADYSISLMKNNIDAVIVVEGNMDVARISNYFDAIFVTTNGHQIPDEEIDFLRHLPKEKDIIILTDSDDAGESIRKRINDKIDRCINLKIDKEKCNHRGKHGVAEAEEDAIKELLTPYIKEVTYGNITSSDLYSLGINHKEKRNLLSKELHLGITNNKTLIKRLNYLNIKLETIAKYGN